MLEKLPFLLGYGVYCQNGGSEKIFFQFLTSCKKCSDAGKIQIAPFKKQQCFTRKNSRCQGYLEQSLSPTVTSNEYFCSWENQVWQLSPVLSLLCGSFWHKEDNVMSAFSLPHLFKGESDFLQNARYVQSYITQA